LYFEASTFREGSIIPPRRLHRLGVNYKGTRLWGKQNAPENEVESRLLLDVVVTKGTTVFELLAGENQALLIRGDATLYTIRQCS
jgi:hypothetical protein